MADKLYWRRDRGKTKTVPLRSGPSSGIVRGSASECSEAHTQKTPKKHTRLSHATLKDLCTEDKHRVRQLIEDLARVGSEKDIVEERLRKEREHNQELLSGMKKQQLQLAEEKEQLESQLHDSQLKMQSLYMYPHSQDPPQDPTHLSGHHQGERISHPLQESSNWPQAAVLENVMIPAHSNQQNVDWILTIPTQNSSTRDCQSTCVSTSTNTHTSVLSAIPPPTQYRTSHAKLTPPFAETTAVSWHSIYGPSIVAGQPAAMPFPLCSAPLCHTPPPTSIVHGCEMQGRSEYTTPVTWTTLPPATPVKEEERISSHNNGPGYHAPATNDDSWIGLPSSSLLPNEIPAPHQYPCRSSKDAETQTTPVESVATQTTPTTLGDTTNEIKKAAPSQPPTDIHSHSGNTQQLPHTATATTEHETTHRHGPPLSSQFQISLSEDNVRSDSQVEEALMAMALLNSQDTMSTIQKLNGNLSSSAAVKDTVENDCAAERLDSPLDLAVSLNEGQSLCLCEILNDTSGGKLATTSAREDGWSRTERHTGRSRSKGHTSNISAEKIPDSLQESDDTQVIKDLFFL